MKRSIIIVELPRSHKQIEVILQEPGIVRSFITLVRPREIISPLAIKNNNAASMVEEIPCLMVEVDPSSTVRRRHRFAIVETDGVLEAESLTYVASIGSQSGHIFHLFEGAWLPPEETAVPVKE